MKKIIAVLSIMVLVFSLTACGGNNETSTENQPSEEDKVKEDDSSDKSSKTDSKNKEDENINLDEDSSNTEKDLDEDDFEDLDEEDSNKENEKLDEDEDESTDRDDEDIEEDGYDGEDENEGPTEGIDENIKDQVDEYVDLSVDRSLEGVKLLESLDFSSKPTSFYTKTKITFQGKESYTSVFVNGNDTRIETFQNGVRTVSIHKGDEGYTYNYTDGETTGQKIKDNDVELGRELSIENSISDKDFSFVKTARIENDGEEDVIYIEGVPSSDGSYSKMWISLKTKMFKKSLFLDASGNVLSEVEMVDFEIGNDYSDKMVPDESITFNE